MSSETNNTFHEELTEDQTALIGLINIIIDLLSERMENFVLESSEYASQKKFIGLLTTSVSLLRKHGISGAKIDQVSILCKKLAEQMTSTQTEIGVTIVKGLIVKIILKVLEYTEYTKELSYVTIMGISNQQHRILEQILQSSTIQVYFDRCDIEVSHSKVLIKECLSYFEKEEIIIIQQERPFQQQVIGLSFNNSTIMIGKQHLANDEMLILFLIHLYFQIPDQYDRYSMHYKEFVVSQCFGKQNHFYSELWPLKFICDTKYQNEQSFVNEWDQDSYQFAQYANQQQVSLNAYTPICQLLDHNNMLNSLIIKIRVMLIDIIELDYGEFLFRNQTQTDTGPVKLHKYYTYLDYWYACYQQMKLCRYEKKRIDNIKAFNKQLQQTNIFLIEILDCLLETDNEEKSMMLQHCLIKLFQPLHASSMKASAFLCREIIGRQVWTRMLSSEDCQLLRKLINSDVIKRVVKIINQSNGSICSDATLLMEYDELIKFLEEVPIIMYQYSHIDGITLINGRIGLNSSLFSDKNLEITRAERIVTLLHEVFSHKKLRDYVLPFDILKNTPECLEYNPLKKAECGFYFEIQVFDQLILQMTQSMADFILCTSNWINKTPEEFRESFKQAQLNDSIQQIGDDSPFNVEQYEHLNEDLQVRVSFNRQTIVGRFTKCCVDLDDDEDD